MQGLESKHVSCPYCGELFEVILDCSVPEQSYIEDCEICCSPIDFYVTVSQDGSVSVSLANENE
ncbi:MAG: hypothetical protein ACI9GW_001029 [Halieaceae bacterium]|jgi:hypothetical protein